MDKTLIEKLVGENYTAKQIGQAIGRSEASARRLLKKYQLKTFRHVDFDPYAQEKKCRYCGVVKPISEFPQAGSKKDEGKYRRWKCQRCTQDTKNKRKCAIRDKVKCLKKKLKCIRCGEDDYRLLDFHHNGNKAFNIADGVRHGFSWERIEKEIAKCDPLCVKCHRIETFENLWSNQDIA